MYYISKLTQAAGLVLILIGFFKDFPKLMNPKVLLVGIFLFAAGFLIEKFLLKGK